MKLIIQKAKSPDDILKAIRAHRGATLLAEFRSYSSESIPWLDESTGKKIQIETRTLNIEQVGGRAVACRVNLPRGSQEQVEHNLEKGKTYLFQLEGLSVVKGAAKAAIDPSQPVLQLD